MIFFRIFFVAFTLGALTVLPVGATTIISPVVEVTVDPGTVQQGVVKVYNETDHDLDVKATIEAVRYSDESGQITFDNERPTFLSWITLERTSLTLQSRQAAIVPLIVQVPKNAAPGGYYAVVFWQEIPSANQDEKNVSINGRVGTLVYLTVTGDIIEQAAISSFGLDSSRKVVLGLPLNFSARVANQGNIHLQPFGKITLTNWLGQKNEVPINQERRSIIPNNTRRFDVVWPGLRQADSWWQHQWQQLVAEINYLAIGPYHVELALEYGKDAPHVVRAETSFIIIPIRLVAAASLVVIFLVIGWHVNRRIEKLKRQKRNV